MGVNAKETLGYLHGLEAWKDACPCCFSDIYPGGLPVAEPMPLSEEDVAYVREEFSALDEVCSLAGEEPRRIRAMIRSGKLPRPPYVLPDLTEMVPSDYFDQVHDAEVAAPERFKGRFRAAAAELRMSSSDGEAEEALTDYVQGGYFVCLRVASPESIARKAWLVEQIDALLKASHPDARDWSDALRARVDELDRLERPFADYDRVRFGPTTRDRFITDVRRRFPNLSSFAEHADEAR